MAFVGAMACASSSPEKPVFDAKLPATFAQLSNVVEVRDGRVAFADTRDRLFLMADFATGKIDTVGHRVDRIARADTGADYKFPGAVADLAADTVALVDFAAERTTLWTGDGHFARMLRLPPYGGSAPVLAYDTLGHGYKVDYRAVIGGGEPGQTARPDSIPLLRIDTKTGVSDTVANLSSPEFGDAKFGEQVQQVAKIFAPIDAFGVLANGTVWVVRGKTNSVDWRSPDGTWTRGPSREYTKIPVTEADKERVMARLREHGLPAEVAISFPFAETKPAFENALGRPTGEVWLQRSRASEDTPIAYDVYGRDAKWQREVVFPKGVSLLGFGTSGAIYAGMKEGERRTVGRFTLQ